MTPAGSSCCLVTRSTAIRIITCDRAVTHLRLNIFPDGGVARLRIFGEVSPDPGGSSEDEPFDLVALENGGRALRCSDEHYGSMHNLNVAGRGVNMGDGWETARRRGPGNDWVILALGQRGIVDGLEIDTAYFKGNYPNTVSVSAVCLDDAADPCDDDLDWAVLLPESALSGDNIHRFAEELEDPGPVTHVRLDIYPDGGISRFRVYGTPEGGTG